MATDKILGDGRRVIFGTSAERSAQYPAPNCAGFEFNETDTSKKYYSDGVSWNQISTAGAGHVTTMPGGVIHIREQDTLSTAVTFDFSAAPIKACELELSMEAATTPDLNSVAFCIDPPNAAVRDAWLTAGTSLSADAQRYTARVKDGKVQLVFTSSVSYIGIKRDLGSDAIRVVAAGVEA